MWTWPKLYTEIFHCHLQVPVCSKLETGWCFCYYLQCSGLVPATCISESRAATRYMQKYLFYVLEVSILEYVRGNSLRNCPTCPHTCGWEYIVSMSFSEPAFDKRQWCMATNCSPTILNSGSESRNQSRSKSRVYTTRPLVEFSNGTTAYSTSSLLTASKQLLIDSFGMDSTSDLNCWASAFVSWKRQNQKMNVPDEYMCLEGPNRLLWPLKS